MRFYRHENLLSLNTWRATDADRRRRQFRRWVRDGEAGPLSWGFDLLNIHWLRPWLSIDTRTISLGLGWGDGSSDDVWRLGLELPLPRRWCLAELTDEDRERIKQTIAASGSGEGT